MVAKKTGRKKSTGKKADWNSGEVFAGLKKILQGFEGKAMVAHDEAGYSYLVTKKLSWKGGPMWFAGVKAGKAYVSYHLLPLYMFPEMEKEVSAELKRRKQGKACFNFKAVDKVLFAEIKSLTKSGLAKYREKDLV